MLAAIAIAIISACSGTGEEPVEEGARPASESFVLRMKECLEEKGWKIEILADGGIAADLDDSQLIQYDGDHGECVERYGYDKPLAPLSERHAEEFYDVLVAVTECVNEHGFSIPEVPSRDSSVQSLVDARDPLWDPYQAVLPEDIPEIMELCPRPD